MTNKSDFMDGEDTSKQESPQELMERLGKLRAILTDYTSKHQSVLLVCHWWVVKYLTSTNHKEILSGESYYGDGVNLDNCGMTTLDL